MRQLQLIVMRDIQKSQLNVQTGQISETEIGRNKKEVVERVPVVQRSEIGIVNLKEDESDSESENEQDYTENEEKVFLYAEVISDL